ncbi:MAG TPA: hypothetical protein VFE37_20840 [Chloroflexota bacterium]|nr:hypothetical protein [Chloroflexota bacterium]
MAVTSPWALAPIEAVLHLMDAARPASAPAVPPCPPRILAAIRHAIHRWHAHSERLVLPPELLAQLEARRGALVCPQCGAAI